jgi:uncharacterized protein (TIGR03067 family)
MRTATLLLFVIIGGTLAAQPARQRPTANDPPKLDGTWVIVSVEIEGTVLAMDKLKESRLTIQGTKYSFRLGDTRLEFTYRLDASRSPSPIDLIVATGPEKGKVYYGICRFQQDRYEICRSTVPGQVRPTEFVTRPGSGLMMVVWQRQKLAN